MSSQDAEPPPPRREQRRSQRLRALASSAYTATAGHLEIEPEVRDGAASRRWLPEPAAAWTLGLVLVLTAVAAAAWMLLGPDREPVPFGEAASGGDPEGAVAEAPGTAEPEIGPPRAEVTADQAAPAASDQAESSDAPAPASERVVVHVAGAVAEPGLVELPGGSRAGDAVESAGGATPDADLSRVNLARPVTDGEQIYLPTIGEDPVSWPLSESAPATAGQDSADGASDSDGALINLNTADATALEVLPGIGPARALAIVEWRETHGGFGAAEDLLQISGIGPATFERLQPLVTW